MRIRIVLSRGQQFVRQQVLECAAAIVGRDPACDVVVGDTSISRQHMRIEMGEAGVFVEDIGSRNGIRVNGAQVRRERVQHLDIVEIGDHQIHVFVESMPTDDDVDVQETAMGAPTDANLANVPVAAAAFDETQPGSMSVPGGPVYVLRRMDRSHADAALLAPRTVVGEPGRAALIVRRRDQLVLTKLSRAPLNVNGIEVEGASCTVAVGDVIDVGAARYELVRVD